jgi:hypothetical protein
MSIDLSFILVLAALLLIGGSALLIDAIWRFLHRSAKGPWRSHQHHTVGSGL